MLVASFLFFLLNSIAAFASSTELPANKCSRVLEEILFRPETCAFKYLQSIARKFQIRSEILFGPQNLVDAFIFSFENEYQIEIDLIDPFGGVVKYYPDGTKSVGVPGQYTDTAQSFLNFAGFVRQVRGKKFYFTFPVYSNEGGYYTVTFYMPLKNDPLVC